MIHVPFTGWTVKSLDSAHRQLKELVENYVTTTLRNTREIPTIHPRRLPLNGYSLPIGERIHDQVETREEFKQYRVYGGWFKSLFEAESFDSFSGEYQLAKLLNTSPRIKWWHRLHPRDRACVQYTANDRYYPDFVAMDTDGIHWIIERKDERGRDDAKVQAKRRATETLVRRLIAEDAYQGQKWGYLIAYEQDIAQSDSWEDLKALTQPTSNVL